MTKKTLYIIFFETQNTTIYSPNTLFSHALEVTSII